MKDYEETYENFWKHLLEDEAGNIDLDKVKKELHDYRFVMEEVPKVYMHISGGLLSNMHYFADGVIARADDVTNDIVEENVKEALEDYKKSLNGNMQANLTIRSDFLK